MALAAVLIGIRVFRNGFRRRARTALCRLTRDDKFERDDGQTDIGELGLDPKSLIPFDDKSRDTHASYVVLLFLAALIDLMSKRINIILPDKTVAVLDRVTTKGNRSRFIDHAVRQLIETQGRQSLREQLRAGYRANADQDLTLAAEWFPLEEEAWTRFERSRKSNRSAKTKR